MLFCREILTPCSPFVCFTAKRITDSHMSACVIESARCRHITNVVNRNQIIVSYVVFHRFRVGIFYILHNTVIITRHTFHEEILTGFRSCRQLSRIILVTFRFRCGKYKDTLRFERIRFDILHFCKRQYEFDSVLFDVFIYGNRFSVYNASRIFKRSCFNLFKPAVRNDEFRKVRRVCKRLFADTYHLRTNVNFRNIVIVFESIVCNNDLVGL